MAILVTPQTKLLVQGITGEFGARHAKLSIDYGTQVVAGVTPGKGGQFFEHGGAKVPIYDTVADAVKQSGATASAVFVPADHAGAAMIEAMKEEVVGFLFNVEVKVEDSKVEANGVTERSSADNLQYSAPAETGSGTVTASGVSRNSPCPCGSGRKYKRCHGASE